MDHTFTRRQQTNWCDRKTSSVKRLFTRFCPEIWQRLYGLHVRGRSIVRLQIHRARDEQICSKQHVFGLFCSQRPVHGSNRSDSQYAQKYDIFSICYAIYVDAKRNINFHLHSSIYFIRYSLESATCKSTKTSSN
jgi:hypothetical protein